MTQFVSFSLHPTDVNTVFGGAQGNGSPASSQATTNSGWGNVLGGDGGHSAIDLSAPSNWYASNPDLAPGGLGIQLCTGGINCRTGSFDTVVTSSTVGGDDGAFYPSFLLDPYSSTAMLVGTCRVWRGPRSGGLFTALSPNFDTLGSGTCDGTEVNQVRALAAGGLQRHQWFEHHLRDDGWPRNRRPHRVGSRRPGLGDQGCLRRSAGVYRCDQ